LIRIIAQRQHRQARRWRVRSALTQNVKSIKAFNVNIRAILLKVASGQQPVRTTVGGRRRGTTANPAVIFITQLQ